jgi:hypothetical protein
MGTAVRSFQFPWPLVLTNKLGTGRGTTYLIRITAAGRALYERK